MTNHSNGTLSADELDQFHASLNRCTAAPAFLERFYKSFLASSPDVREKFAHTNWLRQYRMMVASFHLMSLGAEYESDTDGHMARIAEVHGKGGHNIPPELYDSWLESLLDAVEETDPDYDETIGDLWRRVMRRGISFMQNNAG